MFKGNRSLIERQKSKLSSDGDSTTTLSSGGLVSFNGAMVNVDSVVSNLNKSEKSRLEMELQLVTIENTCGTSNHVVDPFIHLIRLHWSYSQ